MRLERDMFLAFQRGEVETVAKALREGMSADVQCYPSDFEPGAWPYKWYDGDYGDTMCHLAVRYRHTAMLSMLLEHAPSLQLTNDSDKTALQLLEDPVPPKPGKSVLEATGEEYPFSAPAMDEIRSILEAHAPREQAALPGQGIVFDDELPEEGDEEKASGAMSGPISSLNEFFWALRANQVDLVAAALWKGYKPDSECEPADFPADHPTHRWPYCFFDGEYGDTAVHLAVRYRCC